MSAEVEWADPPPDPRRSSSAEGKRYTEFAGTLKANPGRWARFPYDYSDGGACVAQQKIKNGRAEYWRPAGSFEATTRQIDGRRVVFVRYVGDPS